MTWELGFSTICCGYVLKTRGFCKVSCWIDEYVGFLTICMVWVGSLKACWYSTKAGLWTTCCNSAIIGRRMICCTSVMTGWWSTCCETTYIGLLMTGGVMGGVMGGVTGGVVGGVTGGATGGFQGKPGLKKVCGSTETGTWTGAEGSWMGAMGAETGAYIKST